MLKALTVRCGGQLGGSPDLGWDYLPWYNYYLGVSWFRKSLARKNRVIWLCSENVLMVMVEAQESKRNTQCLSRPELGAGTPFITTTAPWWPKPKSQAQARLQGWGNRLWNWKRPGGYRERWRTSHACNQPHYNSSVFLSRCLNVSDPASFPLISPYRNVWPQVTLSPQKRQVVFSPQHVSCLRNPRKQLGLLLRVRCKNY